MSLRTRPHVLAFNQTCTRRPAARSKMSLPTAVLRGRVAYVLRLQNEFEIKMRSNGGDGSSMPASGLRKITSREDGDAAAAAADDDDGLRRMEDDGIGYASGEWGAIRSSSCTQTLVHQKGQGFATPLPSVDACRCTDCIFFSLCTSEVEKAELQQFTLHPKRWTQKKERRGQIRCRMAAECRAIRHVNLLDRA